MTAADDSNAAYTAGQWLQQEFAAVCQLLCIPPEAFDWLEHDDAFALDVVLARAAYELDQL